MMRATIDTPLRGILAREEAAHRPVQLTRLIELPGERFAYTCPGSGALRPSPGEAQEQDHRLREWALEHGLDYPRLGDFSARLLAELTVPGASSEGHAVLAKWYTFLFAHDDLVVDHEDATASALAADVAIYQRMLLGHAEQTPLAIASMLLDCVEDARRLGPRTGPFELALQEYLQAGVEEVRERGRTLSAQEYLEHRSVAGAVDSSFEIAFICMEIELPQSWREHPAYQQMASAAARHICISNDLLSLPKELGYDDNHNFAVLYRESEGLANYRETFAEVTQLLLVPAALEIHAGFAELVAAAAEGEIEAGDGSPSQGIALARRVGGMFRAWVDGHLLWERESRRHRQDPTRAA